MASTTETLYSYQSINIEAPALYAIGDISFSSSGPIALSRSLAGIGYLEGSVIVSSPIICSALQGTCRLAGEAYDQHIGSSLVAWSDIGNLDFRITRENLAGTTYMRWLGKVYQCKKLGNNMIVYGDGGITALIPNGRYFEVRDLMIPGIKGKNAIAGDESAHYFISQRGQLFSLSGTLQISNLGYKRWLVGLSDSVVLSYLQDLERLYIADGVKGFCLTKHGLANSWSTLSGIALKHETLYAVSNTSLAFDKQQLVTDAINFDMPGLKTLSTVTIEGTYPVPPQIAIDYCYAGDNKWKRSSFKRANQGYAYPNITAMAFRIVVKFDTTEVCQISDLSCSYKKTDRRFSRATKIRQTTSATEAV